MSDPSAGSGWPPADAGSATPAQQEVRPTRGSVWMVLVAAFFFVFLGITGLSDVYQDGHYEVGHVRVDEPILLAVSTAFAAAIVWIAVAGRRSFRIAFFLVALLMMDADEHERRNRWGLALFGGMIGGWLASSAINWS